MKFKVTFYMIGGTSISILDVPHKDVLQYGDMHFPEHGGTVNHNVVECLHKLTLSNCEKINLNNVAYMTIERQ